MTEQDSDRNEAATPFKLQRARQRGQVARSTEVASACAFLAAVVFLAWQGMATGEGLLRIARGKFSAKQAQRVRVKVKLFPKARRAVKKGRAVTALVVVRQGGKGTPMVRRVVIRKAKPKH